MDSNKKEIPLFYLRSIGGKISEKGVASLYNFTNEVNAMQYVIEINDYNKPLLNKYELRFASEKFTFEEIFAIGIEFQTFVPNKKIFVKNNLSPEAKQMVNHFDLRFAETLNLITEKLNKQFKNKVMEKRKIELTIETAERWYNGCDRELKELAVQTFPELEKKKLPKSWEELKKINGYWVESDSRTNAVDDCITIPASRNIFATRKQAEASVALAQLSQLREVYRNGFVPDWSGNEYYYCISFFKDRIETGTTRNVNRFLSFKDEETRDLFLKNFKYLIEQAKPLIS